MKNFVINFEKEVIEMTKAFAKEAGKFNSEAYKLLTNARKDFPTYQVIVKTPAKPKPKNKKDNLKGLSCGFMKTYIEKNTDDESIMEAFNALRYGNPNKLQQPAAYGTIRKWFLDRFPEVKDFPNQYIILGKEATEYKPGKAA